MPSALLGRRGARLGELARDAADLHHRRGGREGQHHRHLQERRGRSRGSSSRCGPRSSRAVAALQQESIAAATPRERLLQVARLAGKNRAAGNDASCASTAPSFRGIGYCGTWTMGFPASFPASNVGHDANSYCRV
jgi:hypothetical protein